MFRSRHAALQADHGGLHKHRLRHGVCITIALWKIGTDTRAGLLVLPECFTSMGGGLPYSLCCERHRLGRSWLWLQGCTCTDVLVLSAARRQCDVHARSGTRWPNLVVWCCAVRGGHAIFNDLGRWTLPERSGCTFFMLP